MKRKIFMLICLIALLLCTGSVTGCTKEETPEFLMTATVSAVGEKLEINVTEAEYASGVYLVIISDETEIRDRDGSITSREEIRVGDTVEIVYSGQVMMSYPAQIAARKIRIK